MKKCLIIFLLVISLYSAQIRAIGEWGTLTALGTSISTLLLGYTIYSAYSLKQELLTKIDQPGFFHDFKINSADYDDYAPHKFRRNYKWSETELKFHDQAAPKMKNIVNGFNTYQLIKFIKVKYHLHTCATPLLAGIALESIGFALWSLLNVSK